MSLFSGLFRRGPRTVELSDWLENMKEAFLRFGSETLTQDKSSTDMLVYFTLISTTHAANNVLHAAPSTSSRIGAVYGELRAYFECLWQLSLLMQYESPEEQAKVSKLYAFVSMRIEQTMNSLFSDNPNIKRVLGEAFGKQYEKQLEAAVLEYIQGQHKNPKHNTGDLLADNVQALSSAIQRAARLQEKDRDAVARILSQDTTNALRMTFLTQFDFQRCKFLNLPDHFFKQGPKGRS